MTLPALAWVPLFAQGLYTLSTAPYIVRLVRARQSDQHSLVCYAMLLAGHAIMIGWSLVVAAHIGLALSYAAALAITALETAIIVFYRVRPGAPLPLPRLRRLGARPTTPKG